MAILNKLTSWKSENFSLHDQEEVYELKDPVLSNIDSGDETEESNIQLNENGAPVEKINPLGYNIGYVSLIYLAVSGVIGTGIFGTPASILKSLGSVGASYVLWVAGFIIASLKLFVWLEFVSYFPNRSGGDVAYLEQAYPNPPFLVPTTFAAVNVILSFLSSSAIAFGTYILRAADVDVTTWRQRGIAVGILTFTCILSTLSTKWSLRLSNWIGHVKIVTILFIAITGLVVLGGHTSVEDPKANFRNAWEGTTSDAQSISNAILKVSFTYGGLSYAINLVGEIPVAKRKTGYFKIVPLTFFIIFIFYILIITAYFAGAGTVKEIKATGVLVASAFFENVFKTKAATRALSVLVALSAYGHLIPVVVSHSRSLRECGRQGVLPFRDFWVSTKPFGTPLGPIIATWVVNTIVIIAPPAGDAYNFVVNLGSYSGYVFDFQLSLGLILLRHQRAKAGIKKTGFRIPLPIIIIQLAYQLFVLIMPLVPPKDENGKFTTIGSDLSFFYASFCLVAYGLLIVCFVYYIFWQFVIPNHYGYQHRVERYKLQNGELGNHVIKVKNEDIEEWDRVHGKRLRLNDIEDDSEELGSVGLTNEVEKPKV